jgi:hypothetical protein
MDRSLILTAIYMAFSHVLTGSFEARHTYAQTAFAAFFWF